MESSWCTNLQCEVHRIWKVRSTGSGVHASLPRRCRASFWRDTHKFHVHSAIRKSTFDTIFLNGYPKDTLFKLDQHFLSQCSLSGWISLARIPLLSSISSTRCFADRDVDLRAQQCILPPITEKTVSVSPLNPKTDEGSHIPSGSDRQSDPYQVRCTQPMTYPRGWWIEEADGCNCARCRSRYPMPTWHRFAPWGCGSTAAQSQFLAINSGHLFRLTM